MKNLRHILLAALIIPFASGLCLADGIPLFPRPYVDHDRTFSIGKPSEIFSVEANSSFNVAIFKSAQKSCSVNLDKLNDTFTKLLSQDSTIFSTLDQLIDHSYETANKLSLNILIEDLGEGRKEFSSIYLPRVKGVNGPVIVLDCAVASQMFWQSSLAHELTHALLHRYNVDSWFDEGVAQMMETQAGGIQPEYRISQFSSARENPTLLELRHPFPSGDAYAFSYLFFKYLHAQFGGWGTLQAMVGLDGNDSPCDWNPEFFKKSLCHAQRYLRDTTDLSQLAEKMTPKGILRFFSVAMTMANEDVPIYSIPGWNGYSQPLKQKKVKPYSFVGIKNRPSHPLDPRLETYVILKSGIDFQIKPLAESEAEGAKDLFNKTLLIINPTSQEISIE